MNFCGTLRINVELIAPISGRFRAAAINLSRLFARNWTSRPARSSSTNVKPPAVPTPGLQTNPKERVVTGPDEADQVEANHAGCVLDSRCICENLLHLSRCGAGASLRRGIRELQTDVQISLIFIGEEA